MKYNLAIAFTDEKTGTREQCSRRPQNRQAQTSIQYWISLCDYESVCVCRGNRSLTKGGQEDILRGMFDLNTFAGYLFTDTIQYVSIATGLPLV